MAWQTFKYCHPSAKWRKHKTHMCTHLPLIKVVGLGYLKPHVSWPVDANHREKGRKLLVGNWCNVPTNMRIIDIYCTCWTLSKLKNNNRLTVETFVKVIGKCLNIWQRNSQTLSFSIRVNHTLTNSCNCDSCKRSDQPSHFNNNIKQSSNFHIRGMFCERSIIGSRERLGVQYKTHRRSGVTLLFSEEHWDKSAYLRSLNMTSSIYYYSALLLDFFSKPVIYKQLQELWHFARYRNFFPNVTVNYNVENRGRRIYRERVIIFIMQKALVSQIKHHLI